MPSITLEYILGLYAENKYSEAFAAAEIFLTKHPNSATAMNIAGVCAKYLGNLTLAEQYLAQAVAIHPNYSDAYNNLGNLLHELKRPDDAGNAYRRAIAIEPDYSEAHFNLGNLLKSLNRSSDAEKAYLRSIELRPDYADAFCNLGALYLDLKRYTDAEQAYRTALSIRPGDGIALSKLDHIARHFCDWQTLDEYEEEIIKVINSGIPNGLIPFELLALSKLTPIELRKASRLFADRMYCAGPLPEQLSQLPHQISDRRLRIGYLSADFHDHATARLLVGVIEHLNKARLVTYAYSYGTDKRDAYRQRCEMAFDTFRDLSALSDMAAAQLIANDGINILVELKGYTAGARLGITALRPAPIIVNWLGYPGTLGHPRLADYLIGDPVVTPPEHAGNFSETLALLPHCYQPNDATRAIAPPPARREAGLPDTGFVFCCFNQNYKFTPEMFSTWCKLLQALPDSVLWLLRPNEPRAIENLYLAAEKHGIERVRIIFAPMLPQTEHLGRLQLADLALDTYPITSHTTASDALWAGVPLVTRMGDTFVSRVAASLLNAIGLAELVTRTNTQYTALVLALAHDATRLASIRTKLQVNRQTSPLFDTRLFAQDLERLFFEIWSRHTQGEQGMIALEPKASITESSTKAIASAQAPAALRQPFNGCPLCACTEETRIACIDAHAYPYYDETLPADFNWMRCNRCQHIHTEHYWTAAGLEILLKTTHPHQVAGNLDTEMMRRAWAPIVQRAIGQLDLGLPGTDHPLIWLDAGCGDGSLVMTATEFGFNAIGLDLRPAAVIALKERGYRCFKGDLSTIKVDQPLHVLSMMDLLEHLPDPIHILKRAHRLLRPDGLLLISCPNMTSMSWREMDRQKANPYWGELEHCHNFSRESLTVLLSRCGFKTIRYDISERYKAGMDIICRRAS